MLKNVWARAIWSEYCKYFDELLNAAKIPVIVVPILLPSIKGKTLSSETAPRPTNGVNNEVKTELLCIKSVKTAPIFSFKSIQFAD